MRPLQSGHCVLPLPLWITQLQIHPRSKICPHGFTVAGLLIGSLQITQSSAAGSAGVGASVGWIWGVESLASESEGMVSQELRDDTMSSAVGDSCLDPSCGSESVELPARVGRVGLQGVSG